MIPPGVTESIFKRILYALGKCKFIYRLGVDVNSRHSTVKW